MVVVSGAVLWFPSSRGGRLVATIRILARRDILFCFSTEWGFRICAGKLLSNYFLDALKWSRRRDFDYELILR
jgi:hypothetical protein